MGERLRGKVALVTGGSSGIGRATAELFLKEGARVGILGRTPDEVEAVTEQMTKEGGEAVPLIADISIPEEMEQAVQKLVDRWGQLDIVFANAGINGVWAPIEELSVEDWQKTISINLSGTFYTIKFSVPHMKEHGGSIIVTSSVNGTRMFSNSGASAYATSKAGQVALTQMLALELAPFGIRLNVICPGKIETDIDENTQRQNLEHAGWPAEFPKGKVPLLHGEGGDPEQVARLVLFLASDESDLISGTPVWIDGAQSLLQG
jgi:NAD(P)-dependent dehydrogenase (short-subunit alcohol dehydrogenase family)